MPTFAYSNSDFIAFTKARAADVNTRFSDVKTFFNTTKLDDDNLQDAGITRATKLKAGTAQSFVTNGLLGVMSQVTASNNTTLYKDNTGILVSGQLTALAGGTGQSFDTTTFQTDDVIKISASAFTVGAAPTPSPVKIYNFYRFG